MTSLIKNQVLKHLTKFFKDLAPEQLQLSAFKGSCDLSNLQLEEKVLMELLSFPAWIRINKAVCDQLSIRIPWTKIKSVPIQMNLNEVTVEVEVCEEFRDIQSTSEEDTNHLTNLINNTQAPSKYGFVDRVIDGITVTVNNILISFKSKLMSATFNLSRVSLESRCPNWKAGELSLTRIKDPKRGQILLFKIVEWQTMRLEAKCLTDLNQAPLRLITNHAQCRLTIKKNLEDCSVVAARIFVIFEDILWVLTFAQFTSATSFVEYIFKLIKRSPMSNKTTLLDNQSSASSAGSSVPPNIATSNSSSFGMPQANAPPLMSPLSTPIHSTVRQEKPSMLTGNLSSASLLEQKLLCYDIVETSLHLFIDKIDAHLYDDIETSSTSGGSRDSGGALQTTLDQIQVDCYPYSRVIGDRKHWYKWFDPSPGSRRQWIQGHFTSFDLRKNKVDPGQHNDTTIDPELINSGKGNVTKGDARQKTIINKQTPTVADDQLLSLTVLVKIKDYCMHCVATNNAMRGTGLNKFIETDKDYHMPSEMPALYLELNYFYYFDAVNRMMVYENVPEPLSFVHLSPTKLLFDSPTLVFLNSFQVNLSKAIVHLNDLFPEEANAPKIHCRIEILMPQIMLPAKSQNDQQPNRVPSSLLVKSGKVILSSSIYDREVLSKLLNSVDKLRENPSQPINFGGYQSGSARRDEAFTNDWTRVWNDSLIGDLHNENDAQNQIWAIQFEPVWMDFMNYDVDGLSSGQRLEPIVEPVNAYAYIHLDFSSRLASKSRDLHNASNESVKKRDIISILVSVLDGPILANMDKVQFGFLQRLGMHVEKLIQQIKEDASSVIQLETVVEDTLEINLTAYIKEIKARLILDKKMGTQSFVGGLPNSPLQMDNPPKEIPPLNISMKPLISNSANLGSPKIQPVAPVDREFAGRYSSMLSTLTNPLISKAKDESLSSGPYIVPDESSAIIDEGNLIIGDHLDECIEVADDASYLLLENTYSHTAIKDPPDIDQGLESRRSQALNVPKLNEATENASGNSAGGSTRSVGKSPIEESLLINLDEIEQSSNLFAKMEAKPAAQMSEHSLNSDDCTQSELNRHNHPTNDSNNKAPPQQQDIETESISYLELSMSQLMVRRITETKRRQKF